MCLISLVLALLYFIVGFGRDRSRMASRMKPWQGYVHASVVASSVWFCRETIFEALQWWNGRSPSDGLLLGFCILLTGLACIPIVALHFSHVLVSETILSIIFFFGNIEGPGVGGNSICISKLRQFRALVLKASLFDGLSHYVCFLHAWMVPSNQDILFVPAVCQKMPSAGCGYGSTFHLDAAPNTSAVELSL